MTLLISFEPLKSSAFVVKTLIGGLDGSWLIGEVGNPSSTPCRGWQNLRLKRDSNRNELVQKMAQTSYRWSQFDVVAVKSQDEKCLIVLTLLTFLEDV